MSCSGADENAAVGGVKTRGSAWMEGDDGGGGSDGDVVVCEIEAGLLSGPVEGFVACSRAVVDCVEEFPAEGRVGYRHGGLNWTGVFSTEGRSGDGGRSSAAGGSDGGGE